MKKRANGIISILLVFVMLISLAVPSFSAATEPTLVIDSMQAVKGQEVSVRLSVENNPGMAAATFRIVYDSSILKLNSVNFNTEFGGDFDELGSLALPVSGSDTLKAIQISWSSLSNFNTNGTYLTMNFSVNENASKDSVADVFAVFSTGDFCNLDEEDVNFTAQNGKISVIEGIPGDINMDKVVNSKDLIRLRKYFGGFDVEVDIIACDCNGDGNVNSKDLMRLRKYFSGWDVELFYGPSVPVCSHSLTKTEALPATCTENGNIPYWHCSNCNKYFADENATTEITLQDTILEATGHTPVVDLAVEPTYTTTGLTEGSHCAVCHAVLTKQEVIPMLQKQEYSVKYHVSNNDTYLAQQNIQNNNPAKYTSQEGLVLQDLIVDGYNFKGWYTAQTGGTRVTEFSVGSTGDRVLYAQWEKVVYTVTFDSPDVPVSPVTYTVDKGVTLTNPSWFGYTFVGWSNDDGFIVSSIKPGTTGNITLHANWTSNRNKATSYGTYEKPIIIEDDINGQFLFVYDIGKIDNVPLSQIEYIGNTQTLNIDNEYEITNTITSDKAETVANSVANATTRSSGWTLSEGWNKVYSSGSSETQGQIKSKERTDSEGNVVGGNYFVSNSKGGSSYVSTESGGSSASSSKVTTENSKGINASYDASKSTYVDGKLGVSNTTEVSAGVSLPVKVVDVSAGIKNTTTVSAEVAAGRKDNQAFHVDGQASSYVGTVNENSSSSYYKTSANQSSTWNSTSGYEKSYQTSRNSQISSAISEQLSKTTSYNLSDSLSGQSSKTESVAGTDTRKDEYSSTLKYSEGTAKTTRKHITFHSDRPGYYRLVTAGTVHVYGVVGYDVATASYYTYTFNVLDDERHEYLDYSKDNANFNDCENGVVTFEVPYAVNEYILGVTGKTTGLEFDLNGTVTGFEETNGFEGTVTVPQYYSVNNGDGTYSAYKTKRFNANTFKGNKNIKVVVLPIYVTEIPDGAFEGCTNLERVIAFGVTKIGNNAFKGCTSLQAFSLDNKITSLGTNAFQNAPEVSVMAANSAVAEAALRSGAKRLTLNLSEMKDSFDNRKITVTNATNYFALISNGTAYKNLQVDSNAAETFISNMKFTENNDTPLKLNSPKVTLSRVTVENSPGFALILPAANTELSLFGTIALSSTGENAVISKNVTLSKANAEVAGTLKVTGNYLVCGEITNEKMLSLTNGQIIHISEAEFERMLTSAKVNFDANGGTVSNTSVTVYYGQKYGTLPLPIRDNYTFDGWYTAKTGGTKVTADSVVSALTNQTLYAHWVPKSFKVTFNANGGSVSTAEKTLAFGDSYGTLPTPTRAYYTFNGWYTAATGGTKVSTSAVPTAAKDITLYAQWTQNAVSGWVKASEKPADAQVVNKKYSYTLTSYTTSSASSLSGWTKYDTKSSWGDWGSWSSWQDGYVGANDSRQVETQSVVASYNYKTVYHYYYYSTAKTNGNTSYTKSSSYPNRYTVTFDSPLPKTSEGTQVPKQKYKWSNHHGTGKYMYVYADDPYTTQEVVSTNYKTQYRYRDRTLIYTYYYKKDESKESATYPSGDNISNIQEWVQYRAR